MSEYKIQSEGSTGCTARTTILKVKNAQISFNPVTQNTTIKEHQVYRSSTNSTSK